MVCAAPDKFTMLVPALKLVAELELFDQDPESVKVPEPNVISASSGPPPEVAVRLTLPTDTFAVPLAARPTNEFPDDPPVEPLIVSAPVTARLTPVLTVRLPPR
jgi:hypothetical protein